MKNVITFDITNVKGFLILPEVSLNFLAQLQIFNCLLAQNSQKMLNANQITFSVLVFESILILKMKKNHILHFFTLTQLRVHESHYSFAECTKY